MLEVKASLFWGEFVIGKDGIYTFAHHYQHPQTDREVFLVGVNHSGDRDYFERIGGILDRVELVLYEGLPTDSEDSLEEVQKRDEEDLIKLQNDDPDVAFYPAMRCYSRQVDKYLRGQDPQFVSEHSFFDKTRDNWESGDADFFLRLKGDEDLGLSNLPLERKGAVVNHIKDALERMRNGQFTRRDLGNGFVFLWSDPVMVDLLLESFGKPRDDIVFERFDNFVGERNPHLIGIKFGAAHIHYQRSLLEERGYVLQDSTRLRNMVF